MRTEDYGPVRALWDDSPGVGLSDSDSPAGIARFLDRNPGLSFVALSADRVVGSILCGHDGRRGYIYHLAVAGDRRRGGIARRLVERGLRALADHGIEKCHLMVLKENDGGVRFWKEVGAIDRSELHTMSFPLVRGV